jgi:putative flippase GtrA
LKVSTINKIYKVKEQLNFGQVIRYILVGGISASIEFCVFSILVLYLHVFYLVANVFAFFVAFFIGFWLQKYWTFKNYEKYMLNR